LRREKLLIIWTKENLGMKTSLFTVPLTLLAFFPLLASAELNDEAKRFNAAVIAPTQTELDATVEKNKELTEWNAEHEETLLKLNAVVEILNCKWDEQDGEKNQKCENDIREALTSLWNLEKNEAIESLTDLKDLVTQIRDRKILDTDTFQFSARTRNTYFDGLLKQIETIETTAASNEDVVARREGPHGMAFPTVTQDGNGEVTATSAKTPDVNKVEALTAFLAKSEKLRASLLSCPSRETVAANIKKIEALIAGKDMDLSRLGQQVTTAKATESDLLAESKELQTKSSESAEIARAEKVRKTAANLVSEAISLSVLPLAASGKVSVLGKEVAPADAEKMLLENTVTDVLQEGFAKEGHAKLLKGLKRVNRAEVSKQSPALIKDLTGLDLAAQVASQVIADDQAQMFATKIDVKKVEELPAALKTAIAAIDEDFQKTLANLASEHTKRAGLISAAAAKEIAKLNAEKEVKTAERLALIQERTSVTRCHADLPIVAGTVKAMKKGVSEKIIEETTSKLDSLKQEADVPSLRTK